MTNHDIQPFLAELGVKVRSARRAAGMTLGELALVSGASVAPLHRMEVGKGEPRLSTVLAALRALGLELTVVAKASLDHE